MKNIEELKARIEKFNVESNLIGGYVCIGYGAHISGPSQNWLSNYFNVEVFYKFNSQTVAGNGNDNYTLYYITEEFARKNGLMKPKSLEDIAEEAENFLQQWKENPDHILKFERSGSLHEFDINNPYTVEIFTRKNALNSSPIVQEWAKKHSSAKFVVVITWNKIHHVPFDLKVISLVPSVKKVVLNGSYTAEVHKDKVVVGCQTFSKAKIEELWNALNS